MKPLLFLPAVLSTAALSLDLPRRGRSPPSGSAPTAPANSMRAPPRPPYTTCGRSGFSLSTRRRRHSTCSTGDPLLVVADESSIRAAQADSAPGSRQPEVFPRKFSDERRGRRCLTFLDITVPSQTRYGGKSGVNVRAGPEPNLAAAKSVIPL